MNLRAFIRLALRHGCERGEVPPRVIDTILAHADTPEALVEAIVASEGDVISIKRAVHRVRVWQMWTVQTALLACLRPEASGPGPFTATACR